MSAARRPSRRRREDRTGPSPGSTTTTRRPSFSAARRPTAGTGGGRPVPGTTAPPRLRGRRTREAEPAAVGQVERPSARVFRPVLLGRDAAGDCPVSSVLDLFDGGAAAAGCEPAHCPRGHHPARIGTQLVFGRGDVELEPLNTGRPGNRDHARQVISQALATCAGLASTAVATFDFSDPADIQIPRAPNRTEMTITSNGVSRTG